MAELWVVPEELEDVSTSAYAYEACKVASYVLWAFSGRKYFGSRTVTEQYECPCRAGNGVSFNVYPRLDGAGVVENRLYDRVGGCACGGTVAGRHTRLRLRGTPVREVHEVSKDGVALDPSEYKIVNGSILQLNGSQDVCGIKVTYTYGTGIPVAGQRAARYLAHELCKGYMGDECALPDRVTNVNRQGISFTVMDPQDFLDDGRTGIYEVDLFLRAANPDKARKPARVFSPDLPKAYRVTAKRVNVDLGSLDWEVTPGVTATWTVDLSENGGELLLQDDWEPFGQVTSWNGGTLLEFEADRFDTTGDTLSITLTTQETEAIQANFAMWDLYALNSLDHSTITHVISSTIYNTEAV